MKSPEVLRDRLRSIDGRGYKAYKGIKGEYSFPLFILRVDHVQGDPFAAPSRIRVFVKRDDAGFPERTYGNRSRRVALEDKLTRLFAEAIRKHVSGRRGTGKSGDVGVDLPGQEIIERTSCFVREGDLEVRFTVGLPASGRKVLGRQAGEIFFEELPSLVEDSLIYRNLDGADIERHLDVNEDQDFLRAAIEELGMVAFIANGSILPRRSGIDDRPLTRSAARDAVPFRSPETMSLKIDLPRAGKVEGMGIPEGVNLIVGGGFHGKSTLLRAIERGVYNHIPGDGRELAVTRGDAVKIRSEDGRSVEGVDISPFIGDLPFGEDTVDFRTSNASGSTSQAANIIEALEVGSGCLLIDEDTSATNFMIRDERMQALVAKEKEPITPFVDQVGDLYEREGVSTILVMGGSGDYFDVADKVVMMDTYLPYDVTPKVKDIIKTSRTNRVKEKSGGFEKISFRTPLPESFDASRGKRRVSIKAVGPDKILFGKNEIDLSAVEQLVTVSQTRAIGHIIYYYINKYGGREKSLAQGLQRTIAEIKGQGLDITTPFEVGDLAMPRIFEVASAINRLRALKTKKSPRLKTESVE